MHSRDTKAWVFFFDFIRIDENRFVSHKIGTRQSFFRKHIFNDSFKEPFVLGVDSIPYFRGSLVQDINR
jgi:hypothetical protein